MKHSIIIFWLSEYIKHIIISRSENVSVKWVEKVINQFDGVDESVLEGKPDEKWDEKELVAVTLKQEFALMEIS